MSKNALKMEKLLLFVGKRLKKSYSGICIRLITIDAGFLSYSEPPTLNTRRQKCDCDDCVFSAQHSAFYKTGSNHQKNKNGNIFTIKAHHLKVNMCSVLQKFFALCYLLNLWHALVLFKWNFLLGSTQIFSSSFIFLRSIFMLYNYVVYDAIPSNQKLFHFKPPSKKGVG